MKLDSNFRSGYFGGSVFIKSMFSQIDYMTHHCRLTISEANHYRRPILESQKYEEECFPESPFEWYALVRPIEELKEDNYPNEGITPFFNSMIIEGKTKEDSNEGQENNTPFQILPEHFTGEDHNIKCSTLEKFIVQKANLLMHQFHKRKMFLLQYSIHVDSFSNYIYPSYYDNGTHNFNQILTIKRRNELAHALFDLVLHKRAELRTADIFALSITCFHDFTQKLILEPPTPPLRKQDSTQKKRLISLEKGMQVIAEIKSVLPSYRRLYLDIGWRNQGIVKDKDWKDKYENLRRGDKVRAWITGVDQAKLGQEIITATLVPPEQLEFHLDINFDEDVYEVIPIPLISDTRIKKVKDSSAIEDIIANQKNLSTAEDQNFYQFTKQLKSIIDYYQMENLISLITPPASQIHNKTQNYQNKNEKYLRCSLNGTMHDVQKSFNLVTMHLINWSHLNNYQMLLKALGYGSFLVLNNEPEHKMTRQIKKNKKEQKRSSAMLIVSSSSKCKKVRTDSITLLSDQEEKKELSDEEKRKEKNEERKEYTSKEADEISNAGVMAEKLEGLADINDEKSNDEDYEDEIIVFPPLIKENLFRLDKCHEELEKLQLLYDSLKEVPTINEATKYGNPIFFLAQHVQEQQNLYEIVVRGASISTINTSLYHMKRKIFEEKELEEMRYLEKMKDFEL